MALEAAGTRSPCSHPRRTSRERATASASSASRLSSASTVYAVDGARLVRLSLRFTGCGGLPTKVEHSAEVSRLENEVVAGAAVIAEQRQLIEPGVRGCRLASGNRRPSFGSARVRRSHRRCRDDPRFERNEAPCPLFRFGQLSCDSDHRVVRDGVGRSLEEIRRADDVLARRHSTIIDRLHENARLRRRSQVPTLVIEAPSTRLDDRQSRAPTLSWSLRGMRARSCWSGSR